MLIVPLALLFLAGSAVASSLCAQGTLLAYTNTYNTNSVSNSCQIGDKLFYNFSYNVNVGPAPAASAILILLDPGDGVTNPGLIFSAGGLKVNPGSTMDVTFEYNVATLSGSAVMDDYELSITGSHTLAPNGTASGSVVESFSNVPAVPSLTALVGPGSQIVSTVREDFIPFVSGTHVTTVLSMTSPTGSNDVVTISSITEQFSEEIPEPYEAVLIGSGLLLLGLWRKRIA